MALRARRHREGVDGDWFIDDRCIGCGASMAVASTLIRPARDGRQFVFVRQPQSPEEVVLAQHAAEVCPTRSIGTETGQRWQRHHPVEVAPGVWRTGANSPDTAGGNAFLVPRPGGGVLVDAPRFTPSVSESLDELGGVALILLTHRDDVGDAEQYAEVFGAEVVIHRADHDAAPFATLVLDGEGPIEVAEGIAAIPTPGHTEGHVMYLLDDETLFTGDSLAWDPDVDDLWAEELLCWWSWSHQLDSLERLTAHRFRRVVPTHGGIGPDLDPDEMRTRLSRLITSLRQAQSA